MKTQPDPRKIQDNSWLYIAIGCTLGLLLMGFLVLAFLNTSSKVTGHGLHGVIIERVFVSEPTTEFTVGQGGLRREEKAGEYFLRVRVDSEGGRIYRVPVSKALFDDLKEGDPYFIVKTPEAILSD
jgi:hypothetical protein